MSIREIKSKIKALHERVRECKYKSLEYAELLDEIEDLKAELLRIKP